MKAAERHTQAVTVKLTKKELAALKEMATQQQQTLSAWVRKQLQQKMQREDT